jgi:hypothetical protein
MIRFICKETRTCPEGALTGKRMATFIDINRLEYWLRDANNSDYVDRMLIGCEIIYDEETK